MLDETPVCLTSFPVVLFTDLSLTFRTMDKITQCGEFLVFVLLTILWCVVLAYSVDISKNSR